MVSHAYADDDYSEDSIKEQIDGNKNKGKTSKSDLQTANSHAKLAFTSISLVLSDLETQGKTVDDGYYEYSLTSDPDNEIESELSDRFYDDGYDSGYICYVIENRSLVFAQWKEKKKGTPVGQYPDPNSSVEVEYEWGVKN